ncbi:MAG: hypothetical protein COV70_02120 [Parcubacteria group bacterium CG11_big_fil_rev_8_21_14_0_20_39_22]|nr:MAG: hypothetical protein COV70_02120 [Parcubacteria group bacterium CG11_big_fil_rev_8_21_14_0_20_39_22]
MLREYHIFGLIIAEHDLKFRVFIGRQTGIGFSNPQNPISHLWLYRAILGRALSGVITVLEDRGYMVTVREKINNIKRVGKIYDFPMPYQPK